LGKQGRIGGVGEEAVERKGKIKFSNVLNSTEENTLWETFPNLPGAEPAAEGECGPG
jgi:hypothetical protein